LVNGDPVSVPRRGFRVPCLGAVRGCFGEGGIGQISVRVYAEFGVRVMGYYERVGVSDLGAFGGIGLTGRDQDRGPWSQGSR
jgi:hypothetical protein